MRAAPLSAPRYSELKTKPPVMQATHERAHRVPGAARPCQRSARSRSSSERAQDLAAGARPCAAVRADRGQSSRAVTRIRGTYSARSRRSASAQRFARATRTEDLAAGATRRAAGRADRGRSSRAVPRTRGTLDASAQRSVPAQQYSARRTSRSRRRHRHTSTTRWAGRGREDSPRQPAFETTARADSAARYKSTKTSRRHPQPRWRHRRRTKRIRRCSAARRERAFLPSLARTQPTGRQLRGELLACSRPRATHRTSASGGALSGQQERLGRSRRVRVRCRATSCMHGTRGGRSRGGLRSMGPASSAGRLDAADIGRERQQQLIDRALTRLAVKSPARTARSHSFTIYGRFQIVFPLFPRPHAVASENTFFRGGRVREGAQRGPDPARVGGADQAGPHIRCMGTGGGPEGRLSEQEGPQARPQTPQRGRLQPDRMALVEDRPQDPEDDARDRQRHGSGRKLCAEETRAPTPQPEPQRRLQVGSGAQDRKAEFPPERASASATCRRDAARLPDGGAHRQEARLPRDGGAGPGARIMGEKGSTYCLFAFAVIPSFRLHFSAIRHTPRSFISPPVHSLRGSVSLL